MTELFEQPYGFWLSGILILFLTIAAWKKRHDGFGIPAIVTYATVLLWYHFDAIYNKADFDEVHFNEQVIDAAWWQVTSFCVSFAVLGRFVVRVVNRRYFRNGSILTRLIDDPSFLARLQHLIRPTLGCAATVWIGLTVIALIKTDFDWEGLFFPWMGHLAEPWSRLQMGGTTGFLISTAAYTNTICLALFGIVAALSLSRSVQFASILLCFISWPLVLLDRTRHTMVMVAFPAILAVVGIRLSRRFVLQVLITATVLSLTGIWFKFVMANRTTSSIASALQEGRRKLADKHQGLNMLMELCYMNTFFDNGRYAPNWGYRYFSDAVNVIPRAIWADKPTIGIEYAIARGATSAKGQNLVATTFSTGMIGGGLDNFGPWLGPPAAAVLMAFWVAFLVRLDLTGHRFGRFPLYMFCLVTTPALGRDITPLVVFPAFFGFVILWVAEKALGRNMNRQAQELARIPQQPVKPFHQNGRRRT